LGDLEDAPELAAVLREVDRFRAGADDRHTGGLQSLRESERRLAADLHDDTRKGPTGLLGIDDLEHVLERQRLEVKAVGRVVVGAHRFRIAVDHDRLEARVVEGETGVHTRIVELDALPDPVGPAAQDDDLRCLAGGDFRLLVVRGVVVGRGGRELGGARVDGLEDRPDAGVMATFADLVLRAAEHGRDLAVAAADALGGPQHVLAGGPDVALGRELAPHLRDGQDLVEEPGVDAARLVDLLDGGTETQRSLECVEP
jgi:hypothetical protein